MKPYRSLLFVPGHKPDWVAKALRSGADAIILDLEDAVPEDAKEYARDCVIASIGQLAGAHMGVIVRVNSLETTTYPADVAAVVRAGVDALMLPKVCGRDDVVAFAALVRAAEIGHGLPPAQIGLIPALETASALASVHELARVPGVVSLMAAAARDADVAREVGFRWTPGGSETLYLRSLVVLAARAAGLRHVVLGLWQELADLDGLRDFARANADLGFGGQVVIHPSHVRVVNDEYGTSQEELHRLARLVRTYEQAPDGEGAVRFEGEHIDLAHVQHARAVLAMESEQREVHT